MFVILALGLVVSYEDFRFRKIKNQWIIIGLLAGIFLYSIELLTGGLTLDHFFKIILNALVALALGYGFWYFDLWAAGDAKLFFFFSFLLPFKFYWKTYLPIFPSMVILINAFIPLVIFTLAQASYLFGKKILLFFSAVNLRARLEHRSRKFFQRVKINYLSYLAPAGALILTFFVFQLVRLEADAYLGGFVWGKPGLFFVVMLLGMAGGWLFRKKEALVAAFGILIGYLFWRQFGYAGNIFWDVLPKTLSSLWLITGFAVLNWLFSFYEKESGSKNLHLAFWLLLGVCLTLVLKGSLLMFR